MTTAPDLFAVLGLPRRFDLDPADLERRFHARSRELHPDRFARASLTERRAALERSTRLNDAYRTLKQPLRRAAHLVTLLEPAAGSQSVLGPEFLEGQLEARERLHEARGRGDRAAVAEIAGQARAALNLIERELSALLAAEPLQPEALASVRSALARARYHEVALAEAEDARPLGSLS